MLNFDFLKKGLGIVSYHIMYMIFQENFFLYYTLLTNQMSLFTAFFFLGFWIICVLQLLVSQVVMS